MSSKPITYTLHANNKDQDAIHRGIRYYRLADYGGAIAVYDVRSNGVDIDAPDAIYAAGQWAVLVKDEDE